MSPPTRQTVTRRRFLGALAAAASAAASAGLARGAQPRAALVARHGAVAAAPPGHSKGANPMRNPMPSPDDTTVRPFRVEVPQADLDDLRARLAATRWPHQEL